MTRRVRRGTQQAARRMRLEDPGMAVSKLVAVRLPDELVERLDEYASRMERLHGLKLSRSQQIKSLVELGLKAALEGEASPHSRKR